MSIWSTIFIREVEGKYFMNSNEISLEKETVELKSLEEEVIFLHNSLEIGRVKIGWDYIGKRFVKSQIPNEMEIENAINYIEDELMKDLSLKNTHNFNLYTKDKDLIDLLGEKKKSLTYTIGEIEEEFTKYALLSMGRSPVIDGIELNNKRYIALLVIREILHHLKFDGITLIA